MANEARAVEVIRLEPGIEDALRYVARQPILDRQGRVHGYELLFRNGPEQIFSGDGDLATRTMLDNTVIFGLERLTGGATAFVNCTREALTDSLVDVLPPSQTVLEILETLELTPELIESCRALKKSGYRLALDDFTWREGVEPLVELADYIKIDFTISGPIERAWIMRKLGKKAVALVAEKVETQEEYEEACAEGFTLFQGYYFCRPMLMENRKVPANRTSHFEILRMLKDPSVDLNRLADAVKRDTSLTYRLLRLINSPVYAIHQEVRSIQTVLVTVGEETFRRVAMLAIASEINANQPVELLRMALIRGRFCELAAPRASLDETEQYLVGMLSLLPAMLRMPPEQMIPSLPLREQIRNVLMGMNLPEGRLLQWMIDREHGDWDGCDGIVRKIGVSREALEECYASALVWAETVVRYI
ncbi:MAG: HDOD domain-containing protein [Terracidiphilus sp.]|nr:HDOD domain-containing protein [Terracidiphilus sp.]